jgi:integrase
MAGKQAKILSEDDLQDLLVYASSTRNPIRNRVIALLSAKAGLRAGEIANLTWDMVLEPSGAISTVVELRDHAAKKRSGRLIPLHAELRDALSGWRSITRGTGPVVLSERGRAMIPLSIVIWFARAYRAIARVAQRSSPVRHDWFTRRADRCAMSSC